MCRISDEIREEGREEGREETKLADLRSVMCNMGVSVQRALDVLAVPESERARYESLLQNGGAES